MSIVYGFDIEPGICLSFTSVSACRRWLERKCSESESSEAFEVWLTNFFDDGNAVSVRGEPYDFWACWELL